VSKILIETKKDNPNKSKKNNLLQEVICFVFCGFYLQQTNRVYKQLVKKKQN
jgi:hypothetical protein